MQKLIFAECCGSWILLLCEQQMTWEETISGQTVATMVSHQPDLISLLKPNVGASTCCDEPALLCGEWVQDQVSITQQIYAGSEVVDRTMELKLVNTWLLAGEESCLGVVGVLSIVDDIMEGDGRTRFGEVVAQAHREGHIHWGTRRSRRSGWSSGPCVRKDTCRVKNLLLIK